MTSLVMEQIRDFIGIPPVGFEWLEYVFGGLFFLMVFQFVADLFRTASSFLNMRR